MADVEVVIAKDYKGDAVYHAEQRKRYSLAEGEVIDLASERPRPSTAAEKRDLESTLGQGTSDAAQKTGDGLNSNDFLATRMLAFFNTCAAADSLAAFATANPEKDGLSSTTPQHHTSPSDDVSLNLEPRRQEGQDVNVRVYIRSHDESPAEERRVAFLPPPRVWVLIICPNIARPSVLTLKQIASLRPSTFLVSCWTTSYWIRIWNSSNGTNRSPLSARDSADREGLFGWRVGSVGIILTIPSER